MIEIFQIAKLKIKKSLKILSNTDKLQLEQHYNKHPFLKKIKVKKLIDDLEIYSKIDKDNAWESIEFKIEKRKSKNVFKLFEKSWLKYTAAAILTGVLTTAYLYKPNLFNSPSQINPSIVNTSNLIMPGTDKAILTLEDGSTVSLEKGDSVHTKNANSNGEKIVYKGTISNTNKIAFNYLTIPRGGQFHLVLADETEVWLNSESQLKFPVSFKEGDERKVQLVYGEAYFKVSPSTKHKGAKFKVLNNKEEIEVLGTEFNIKAYHNDSGTATTLIEGKIALNYQEKKQYLKPNQQSYLNFKTNELSLKTVDVYNEISWKEGVFSFENKSLKEIMKVLARWYDIKVIFENPETESIEFKGVLDKNQNVQDILKMIKNSKVIKDYKVDNKTVIIK